MISRRTSAYVLAAISLLLAPDVLARPGVSRPAPMPAAVPGELVLRLKQTTLSEKSSRAALDAVMRDLGASLALKSAPEAKPFATDASFALVRLPDAQKSAALERLKQDARVAYAEPNFLYHSLELPAGQPGSATPNDELFPQLWGLKNSGQADSTGHAGRPGADIHVEPVWAAGVTGSRRITVAVIDTGVDYSHPDLKENLWTNPREIPGNGVDDDGDGFIDDVHGWNFSTQAPDSNVPVIPSDPKDDHYHGTHCAGTIGGMGNNGTGVVGVNWQVTILPVKFLNSKGSGSLASAVQAIQYATKQHVQILSNSWGGGPFSQALLDAIREARDAGILFVAAAGNDGSDNDSTPSYPASYDLDNVVSVAATDNRDRLASFSNFGRTRVHVAAPGVNILSTAPTDKGSYRVLSGTSMATPHVSGIAALMLAANPGLSYAQIKDALIRTSDPVHALGRKSVSGGRVNVDNAIHGRIPAPIVVPEERAWVDVPNIAIESQHPYAERKKEVFPISVPGAKYLRVVFEKIEVEAQFDFVRVQQSNGDEIEKLTGASAGVVTDFLEGDSATIILDSDETVAKWGFKVAKVQAIF